MGGKSEKHTLAWTLNRREQQRQRILKAKIWEKSTGAKTIEGKNIVSRNACKTKINQAGD
ncbi:hypothetical protein [Acinetobacter boissieri]|uniref:Uncharacterized protein n=1 Tax=Acinetobacter boissieri TaxID=1219383 RepID=A0A1G6HE22_9GAMM|nr:hypothetical protein [Acinetobacter boissieri]SDB92393.1 hypothetical protein SAMN05421733_10571 [Acinetobacter boissieri]